jgi:tRNA-dihydrouridine synthase
MKWFAKDSKKNKMEDADSVDEFKDFLDKSIREENTQVVQNKRQDNRMKSMARLLMENGFSVEEINSFCKSKKIYHVLDGELQERE